MTTSAAVELSEATGRNRFEFVLPLNDASRLPVIVSSRRFEDPDGRDFAIVTFTDISHQKSTEAQLRDQGRVRSFVWPCASWVTIRAVNP